MSTQASFNSLCPDIGLYPIVFTCRWNLLISLGNIGFYNTCHEELFTFSNFHKAATKRQTTKVDLTLHFNVCFIS